MVQLVDSPAHEERVKELMQRAGMSPAQIAKVDFVVGTPDVVRDVVALAKADREME